MKLNSELKVIRQQKVKYEIRLAPIEGKLNGLESSMGHLQGDVLTAKHKISSIEESLTDVHTSL